MFLTHTHSHIILLLTQNLPLWSTSTGLFSLILPHILIPPSRTHIPIPAHVLTHAHGHAHVHVLTHAQGHTHLSLQISFFIQLIFFFLSLAHHLFIQPPRSDHSFSFCTLPTRTDSTDFRTPDDFKVCKFGFLVPYFKSIGSFINFTKRE